MTGGVSATAVLDLLAHGEIAIKGRLPWSSNATFLVELTGEGGTTLAVYKPMRGERPLWDFPRGLFRREIAAYLLDEWLGWGLVPPTLPRVGPLGEGSVQLFVPADFEQHYFTLRTMPEHLPTFRLICLFDLLANNADRKSGHSLLSSDGRIYAIDNGLCFHVEPKLRTVIWEFGGEPIPESALADVERVAGGRAPAVLAELLTADERRALRARARALLGAREFPADPTGLRYPWPLV
jgi:hypothetical protein